MLLAYPSVTARTSQPIRPEFRHPNQSRTAPNKYIGSVRPPRTLTDSGPTSGHGHTSANAGAPTLATGWPSSLDDAYILPLFLDKAFGLIKR